MEFLHFLSKHCKDEKEITKLDELSEVIYKYFFIYIYMYEYNLLY